MEQELKLSASMENINTIIARIRKNLKSNSALKCQQSTESKSTQSTLKNTDLYNLDPVCQKCKYRPSGADCKYSEAGFIPVKQDNSADVMVECLIHKRDKAKRLWNKSGINMDNQDLTFKNFNECSDMSKLMKAKAMEYSLNFEKIKDKRNNSLALLGQVGSGKTHLSIAISNYLINQKAVEVRYFQFREVITILKQTNNSLNAEIYQQLISKYKTTPLLLIDDLFKKGRKEDSVSDADIRIMFEIINYRYINRLPVVVSSEMFADEILDIDEGLGSRIVEMSKGYMVEIEKNRKNNYRLKDMYYE